MGDRDEARRTSGAYIVWEMDSDNVVGGEGVLHERRTWRRGGVPKTVTRHQKRDWGRQEGLDAE